MIFFEQNFMQHPIDSIEVIDETSNFRQKMYFENKKQKKNRIFLLAKTGNA